MVKRMRVDGADISHHQNGDLNLRAFKNAGGKFLYHKATEGASFVDSMYDRRRREAAAAKIPFGAYHFARPERGDAKIEARHFMKIAKPKPGDLCPALDLEDTGGLNVASLTQWTGEFVQEIERLAGVESLLYTPFRLNNYFRSMLWRPRYNNDNRPPELNDWDIWQFSNGVLGVPNSIAGLGHVDLNTLRDGVRVGDFRIPVEDKDEPSASRSGWMRFVTQNIKALPKMPQEDVVEDVKLTASQAGIVCWQEIFPERYIRAIKNQLSDRWEHHFAGGGCPISWRKATWTKIRGDATKLHDAEGGISRERLLTWVLLEHKRTGARVIVHNWHYVAAAWNPKIEPNERRRDELWAQDNQRHRSFVETWVKRGVPIIGGGDSNRRHDHPQGPLLGNRIGNRRVRYPIGPKSIDHIVVINGEDWKWQIDDKNGELLPGRNSDHQGRRTQVRLVKK